MAYNATLGYDPDKDYTATLLNPNLSQQERNQNLKEREAKVAHMYGGVEPLMAGSALTYSQAYDAATGAKKDTSSSTSTPQNTSYTNSSSTLPQNNSYTNNSSTGAKYDALIYHTNTMTDDGSRPDYSKLISNAILDGKSATEVQTLLNLRNDVIDANPSLEKYRNDEVAQLANMYIAEHQNDTDTLIENWKELYNSTYNQALNQSSKATDASVERAISELNAQKTTTSQSYADLFRQLYRDKMKSQKNINQRLAAQGITGGMSESSLLGLETSYADALRQGEQERINTLSELDRAITDTRLSGDVTKAQEALEYATKSADSYAGILQSLISRNDTLEYNNKVQEANEQAAYREIVLGMLQSGAPVSDELLTASGISRTKADAILSAVKASQQKDTPTMTESAALSAIKNGYIDETIISVLKANGYPDDLIGYYYQTALQSPSSTLTSSDALALLKNGYMDDMIISVLKANGFTDGMINHYYQNADRTYDNTPEGWSRLIEDYNLADENNQISEENWQFLIDNGASEDMLVSLEFTKKITESAFPSLNNMSFNGQKILNMILSAQKSRETPGITESEKSIILREAEQGNLTEADLKNIVKILGINLEA